jgi:V8-like Glu-specific endopeptidase
MRWNRTRTHINIALSSVLALSVPAIAAETTTGHLSVYTAGGAQSAPVAGATAQSNMPLIDPALLPPAALMQHNSLPTGVRALIQGSSQGSADGAHLLTAPPVSPEAYGNFSPQAIAPYTTARASATVEGTTPTAASVAVTSYPWRATGKLTYNIVGSPLTWNCTASLIAPGLLITAAHCVYEYGTNTEAGWHYNFAWVPAQYEAGATPPYGTSTALTERIPSVYYAGTDTCVTAGITCNNDIAIITIAAKNGVLPGTTVGWYSYGWNGYSYTTSFGGASLASITQLGYPLAFDSGLMMERTDGVGSYWTSGSLKNTVLGSAQTGGSSGGPWLVNFGAVPVLSTAASAGNEPNPQVVVGVTSWGYTTVGQNTQGSSWFGQNTEYPLAAYADSHGVGRGAGNIGLLVADSCTANFDHC